MLPSMLCQSPVAHMNTQRVPPDFPKPSSQGAISGAQPKLIVRKAGDEYRASPTDAEVYERYIVCDDLAQQLAAYTSRKMSANAWSLEIAIAKVEVGVQKKVRSGVWDFSAAEIAWTLGRTRELLTGTAASETSVEPDLNSSDRHRNGGHGE